MKGWSGDSECMGGVETVIVWVERQGVGVEREKVCVGVEKG